MVLACSVCRSAEVDVVFRSRLRYSVRSDWKPVATPMEIWACGSCGHVFKPDAITNANSDYVNYTVMDNDPSIDKLEFSTSEPQSRSAKIRDHLKTHGFYAEGARLLDYGCNRGAFLATLPPARHGGFEVSTHYRPVIEALGFDFYSPVDPPPRGTYDGVTLIHVLEHLQDIPGMLQPALTAAKDDAFFLIQVPDIERQISDAYVIDHCSHFLPATMVRALEAVGLHPEREVERIIPGELTAVFSRSGDRAGAAGHPGADEPVHARLERELGETEARVAELAASSAPIVIYGAGLLASLVNALFEERVVAFVDDNPKYHGKAFFGVPVLPPEELRGRRDAVFALAVPPAATERVAQKCVVQGMRPFPLFSYRSAGS